MHSAEACISQAPVEHSPGLALPPSRETDIESLRYPDRKVGSFQYSGLPAPAFSQPLPSSLQSTISDVAYDLASPVRDRLQLHGPSQPGTEFSLNPKGIQQNPKQRFSQQASNLTRVRISSSSPIVWNLWTNFSDQMLPFSSVLQQLRSSEFCTEHSERFLNQFAATTLVRYMSCLLQFLQLCVIMHVNVNDLSEAVLADLLISGALARRADGSGPKCSITIKSLRWAHKQLGVHAFGCAFGALVASFEKQKFESDRKESLPYPLFVLMKWEPRDPKVQYTLGRSDYSGWIFAAVLVRSTLQRFAAVQIVYMAIRLPFTAGFDMEGQDLQHFNTIWCGHIGSTIQRHVDMDP